MVLILEVNFKNWKQEVEGDTRNQKTTKEGAWFAVNADSDQGYYGHWTVMTAQLNVSIISCFGPPKASEKAQC